MCNQNAIHGIKKHFEDDYAYTCVIEMENDAPLTFGITGKGLLPQIQLSQTNFQFGECPVNLNRDIKY